MKKYIDLHTHSTNSDGLYDVNELINLAIANEIGVLAITDHNKLLEDIDKIQKENKEIILVPASEISSNYIFKSGRKEEIHIVGLFLQHNQKIRKFLEGNRSDGAERAKGILKRLREECGIDLGTIEDFPKIPSRTQIAELICKSGKACSIDEAFNIFVGNRGERRAYVPDYFVYAPMETVIKEIRHAGGMAVLAHPGGYNLSDIELDELVKSFSEYEGQAIEVYYSAYDEAEKAKIIALANKYNLTASAGSDFHTFDNGRLNHRFPYEIYEELLRRHKMEKE